MPEMIPLATALKPMVNNPATAAYNKPLLNKFFRRRSFLLTSSIPFSIPLIMIERINVICTTYNPTITWKWKVGIPPLQNASKIH